MFYLVLPSDSSRQLFPHNTLTHFTTKLPRPITLAGEWEVGLVEIQYPHNWYNLHNRHAWFKFKLSHDEDFRTFSLKSGFYDGGNMLAAEMSRLIAKVTGAPDKVKITYNKITHKMLVIIAAGAVFELSLGLRKLLGWSASARFAGPARVWSEVVVDVNQGFYSLYVYCNLVETRMVGDSMVPLLRVVSVQGGDGDMICRAFDHVQYVPLLQKAFQEVEVDIRNDMGEPVPFERAKVVLTLHFRKKRPEL